MRLRKGRIREISLKEKLRNIIMGMLIPLVFCVILALIILGFYANQYSQIAHNVVLSSKFSLNFKETVDLKMYLYTVGSKEQTEIPISYVNRTIKLAESLKTTTYRKESRQSIDNILAYCSNLEKKMYMIGETKDYDSRQIQLENNIYVLTNLIQSELMDYIYYEDGYMATLEKKMLQDIKLAIAIAVIFVAGTVIVLLYYGIRFSNSITRPIRKLCENVNRVGNGIFTLPQVEANYYEMAQLNCGIQQMAGRISHLLDNVKEEEKLQHLTHLQLLQAQINPHFLYNTLDTIVWLVESERYEEAVNMLSNLSVFFRTTLSKGHDMISLGEEIMHTRSYLEIQQVRYQDILDYDITIPEILKMIQVPKLTLQPLAENALYHGVKEKRGKSKITITCEEQGEDIVLTVSDNGIGIQQEKLRAIRHSLDNSEHVGFGLTAVHERVKLYFGESYGIHIDSEYGSGTTVEVRIPKNIEHS